MGIHKIADRRALPQEFRAANHRERYWPWLVAGNNLSNPVTGSDGNGGFIDDDQRILHLLRD